MPVISYEYDEFPDWSEVKDCKAVQMSESQKFELTSRYPNSAVFVLQGAAEIRGKTGKQTVSSGDVLDYFTDSLWIDPQPEIKLLRISGFWGSDRGSCGVFRLEQSEPGHNDGDPADYDRNTIFDKHFHDCDEYWIIIEGKGLVVSEGVRYRVQAGDCVITRAGEHHDFPIVDEPILAVWFEGSMVGKKRPGHLYCEK